jgi:hypothetical protein
MKSLETLTVARRFCGPPNSGNGGYVCGRVAAHIAGGASVRLKAPPPLETALAIIVSGSGVQLRRGETVVAEGQPAVVDIAVPPAPSFADAEEACKSFSGFRHHPFPTCFVCGPQRSSGDALRIFPGPLAAGDVLAAPWIPDRSLATASGRVGAEFIWAALDCTSCFPVLPVPPGKALVLGELAVRIDAPIAAGERHVVIGWALKIEGRKRLAGSAVYASGDRPAAVASATWIEVDAKAFGARPVELR